MFKVGDRVRATIDCSGSEEGKVYTLQVCTDGDLKLGGTNCTCKEGWELVEETTINKKTFMKQLKGLMKKLLDADTQKLVKADYINGDLELTEKGKNTIFEMIFLENKAELVKLAEEEIKEAEKESK